VTSLCNYLLYTLFKAQNITFLKYEVFFFIILATTSILLFPTSLYNMPFGNEVFCFGFLVLCVYLFINVLVKVNYLGDNINSPFFSDFQD